jgi:uncharacterized membrane protein YadS
VARSISTIFLFNVIAAFLFPVLGHLLGMTDYHFGLWAGTAVNDTSSVVAAGYTFSNAAGNLAVIVKLTRTLMIVPVTLALAFYTSGKKMKTAGGGYRLSKIFLVILGFGGRLRSSARFCRCLPGTGKLLAKIGKFVTRYGMTADRAEQNTLSS